MRYASPLVGVLTIILLIAVPVGGSPALQVGSNATYGLSATVSIMLPICNGASAGMMYCSYGSMLPQIPPRFNVTGTLGWAATDVSSTSATLNVSRDATISSDDLMIPSIHRTGSFNETINLATRTISIMPLLKTEMDEAVQMEQSAISSMLPSGTSLATAMNAIESSVSTRGVYTMWWINDPAGLKVNDTVPVLVFPANVTGSSSVNLGQLGTRQAWTLSFAPRPFSQVENYGLSNSTARLDYGAAFTFNYDQKSGVLLSASVSIHLGIEEYASSSGCMTLDNPPIAWCNDGSIVTESSGFDVNASLTLSSTNLNLDQIMGPGASSTTTDSGSNGGSSDTGSGIGPGSSQGPGSGSGSSPGSTPLSSSPALSAGFAPWTYLTLGLVTIAIATSALWIARRRSKKHSPANTP
jgi:hypothetical protein